MKNNGTVSKRKNIFIDKRFQMNFAIKFLILIVIESLLAIGLFIYLSKGTVITGFSGSELIIARTGEYFLPTLLLTNLAVIGVTAAIGFVILLYVSHKIAGPLYRFEQSLDDIGNGDLTHRFNLRADDQLGILADKMNEFTSTMDSAVSGIQGTAAELDRLLTEAENAMRSGAAADRIAPLISEAKGKITSIERSSGYFKTSMRAKKSL